jgi:hypothetical protein
VATILERICLVSALLLLMKENPLPLKQLFSLMDNSNY